jgi:integrase
LTSYQISSKNLPSKHHNSTNGWKSVRVKLKGLAQSNKRLADGTIKIYYYAWRGGPQIKAEPGTGEFHAAYAKAHEQRKKVNEGELFSLIVDFKASSDFPTNEKTKRDYLRYLRLIEDEFGDLPIAALEDKAVRGVFKKWRDGMAATPRKADYAWTVLARVLSVAKDRGRIGVNHCERGGRLYDGERSDKIWTEGDLAKLFASAPERITIAALLALWSGQRETDLLRLRWTAYDGTHIRLRQGKSGRRLKIPVGKPLRDKLDAMPRVGETILTNSYRQTWTGDGFRTSWGKALKTAAVEDLTFHDLRGSAVTRLAIAGCSVPEIASITGHSLKDVEDILDKHYLSRDQQLAENAIRKMEREAEKQDQTGNVASNSAYLNEGKRGQQ